MHPKPPLTLLSLLILLPLTSLTAEPIHRPLRPGYVAQSVYLECISNCFGPTLEEMLSLPASLLITYRLKPDWQTTEIISEDVMLLATGEQQETPDRECAKEVILELPQTLLEKYSFPLPTSNHSRYSVMFRDPKQSTPRPSPSTPFVHGTLKSRGKEYYVTDHGTFPATK